MNNDIVTLADESINLEQNISKLYLQFYYFFPVDADFWWRLLSEENNHAALIRSGIKYFEPIGEFPHKILSDNLQGIKEVNKKLHSLLNQFKNTPPSREEAFNIALDLENSAGELHFQCFLNKEANSKIDEIFHQLNRADKEHAERISSCMKNNDISVQSEKK